MDLQYLKRVLTYVLSSLLSIGLVAFIIYHLVGSLTTDVETAPIVYTTQEEAEVFDAYFFRGEYLLYTTSPEGGIISHLCEDGEKVAVGEAVCNVYEGSVSEENTQLIADIDRKLERLYNSNLQENVTYSDTHIIDTAINNTYYTLLARVADGNAGYAMAKADDLVASLNQRRIVTRQVDSFDEQIAALEAQRDALIQSTGEASETVYTTRSGYYYADIDGFENVFDFNRLDNMTLDDYARITSASADMSLQQSTEGGVSCGKIITDYNWYLTCQITTEQSRAFTENYTYTVIFPYNSDIRISMVLDRIILEADDDRVVLVFRSNIIPENFNFLRRQDVQIVTNTYEGYKIPLAAVRIKDGVQGVYILEGYVVKFRRIEPMQEIDGYFICRANDGTAADAGMVALYDHIITSGKNLYEGRIIS